MEELLLSSFRLPAPSWLQELLLIKWSGTPDVPVTFLRWWLLNTRELRLFSASSWGQCKNFVWDTQHFFFPLIGNFCPKKLQRHLYPGPEIPLFLQTSGPPLAASPGAGALPGVGEPTGQSVFKQHWSPPKSFRPFLHFKTARIREQTCNTCQLHFLKHSCNTFNMVNITR